MFLFIIYYLFFQSLELWVRTDISTKKFVFVFQFVLFLNLFKETIFSVQETNILFDTVNGQKSHLGFFNG